MLAACATGANTSIERGGTLASDSSQYTITGSGGKTTGPLQITRIELRFADGRAEATVPQGARLAARAVIRTDGNGLLRAIWLADGRPLEQVTVNLSAGSTLTITTGKATQLPTFEPGPHTLSLQIQEPQPAFKVPVIRYFVTGNRANGK